jgi:hypothetical protein
MSTTTAVEMAKQADVDPQRFRKTLRKRKEESPEEFKWHDLGDKWIVDVGSEHHAAMLRVLRGLSK